jgi:predicted metal-dependent enzyme (double-stranded beta helix superfamily)
MFDSTDIFTARHMDTVQDVPREPSPLATLCTALDAALDEHGTGFAAHVHRALSTAVATRNWLPAAHRIANPDRYCRHVLAADPQGRYTIVSLVWLPGQASPVHGHLAWCAYAVVAGGLSETCYRYDDTIAAARAVSSRPRRPGDVWFAYPGLTAIHRLGHTAPAGTAAEPAISLHVYGVAADIVGTRVNDLVRVV